MNPNLSFLREDAERTKRHEAFTEGVTDFYQRAVIETLMDNAAVSEARMQEDNSTASVAVFTRVAKPLIRRIYAGLVANQLISIQPMSMPTTKVFYLDLAYGSDQAPTTKGQRFDMEAGSAPNKFYAAGVIKGEVLGTGNGVATTFNTDIWPIRPGSLTVRVNSVVVTNYTVDEDTGAIVFAAAPANAATIVGDYALVMEHLGSKGNSQIAELEMSMRSATVDAEEVKLKSKWTLEGQQDLRAYHGLSMEDELTKQMGDEIRRELDRLIIDDLYTNATAANVTWSKAVPAGSTMKDHYETLVHGIGDVSNEIYKKRLRHASFVVMAPDTVNMLDKMNTFRMTSGNTQDGFQTTASLAAGPNVMGTLANRYNVIVDPLFPTNKVLVGFKGANWQETGYVYSPYTAFETATFIDPNTMKPVKGLMSRFGRHLVNGDYYGTVTITA